MKKAVIGIVPTLIQAEAIVSELREAGFMTSDLSVLLPNKHGQRELVVEHSTKAPEGVASGAGAGGLLGGALGLLAGVGALAIPGLGPFIAAGPIMAALSGAAAGAAVGGFVGALVGMGIPEYEAKAYEKRLRAGNILLAVHTETSDEQALALQVFKKAGVADAAAKAEVGARRDAADERKAPGSR
jgi:hypothetical protein